MKFDKLKQTREKIKKKLLKNKTPIVVYYPYYYIPLELLESAGINYISWEHFLNLFGCSDEWREKRKVNLYFPPDFCIYSQSCFVLELENSAPKISKFFSVYTCDAITKSSEYFENVFPMHYINLPRIKNENTIKGWYYEIEKIKRTLENLMGKAIDFETLKESILKEMTIRRKLKNLAASKRMYDFSLSSKELYFLFHLRYMCNQSEYDNLLDEIMLFVSKNSFKNSVKKSRIYLAGAPFLEQPVTTLLTQLFAAEEIIEFIENNQFIPIEECWRLILCEPNLELLNYYGEPLRLLGDYYYENIKAAYMLHNCDRAIKNIKMAKYFKVKGCIYLNYRGCREFLAEVKIHKELFEKEKIPFMYLQISGETTGVEQLRTRIESFLWKLKDEGN